MDSVTIRPAREDAVALLELAVLDDANQLEGEVLLPLRARTLAERPAERNRKRRTGLYAGPARWSTR